ncbi:hypothetical protein ANCCAN_29617 [Ancylostoma caninum]|uniref:Uncharacterized protein n=1 Tax=Ancylostoma caninum TaxID=29170 RepID=A0A368EY12_ANCCA|nr:hypothetical protein ANCCAN_29617 [Ancylostoma caninum]
MPPLHLTRYASPSPALLRSCSQSEDQLLKLKLLKMSLPKKIDTLSFLALYVGNIVQ